MKKFRLLMYASIILVMSGCSQDYSFEDSDENITPINSDRISKLIGDVYKKVHHETRSIPGQFTIKDISTRKYLIPDSIATRSENFSNEEEYEIHTVSVDFGETTGYVILSDTPGIEHVFCYTESGCVSDSALIPPLKDFIDAAPAVAELILKNSTNQQEQTTRAVEDYDIGPLVPFQWHQEQPFNNYATYCTCDKCAKRGNHMPAGCCAIAVGQVMATVKRFNGTFYGNRNIDYDNLIRYTTSIKNYTDAQALSVAHYLQEVALTCQTKYGCDGSSSTAKSVANCLKDNGYDAEFVSGSLDMQRYIRNLQNGLPHLASGVRDEGKGHMWVVDGIQTVNEQNLMHTNWGWGCSVSNGWYSSYYFFFKEDESYYEKYGVHLGSSKTYDKSQQQIYLGK